MPGKLHVGDYLDPLSKNVAVDDDSEVRDAEYKLAADAITAGSIQTPPVEPSLGLKELYGRIQESVKDLDIKHDFKSVLDNKLAGGFTRDELVVFAATGGTHPNPSGLGLEMARRTGVSTIIDLEPLPVVDDKLVNLIIQKGRECGKTLIHFDAFDPVSRLCLDAESEGTEMIPRDFVSSTMPLLNHHDNPDPAEKIGWKYSPGGEVCCNVNLPKKRKERKAKAKLANKSKVKNRK